MNDTARAGEDAKRVFPDWVCAVSSSSCTLAAEPPVPSSCVLSPGSRAELRRRGVDISTGYDLVTAPAEVCGEAGVVEAGGREPVAGEGEHGAELVRQPRHVVQRTHVRHPAYTHLPTNI